jgi:DNA-binding GntR family transcriptional regulator
VERSTKAEEIAQLLEQAIRSGELAPGAILRQEQLSADFGVSRTPVREALRQLAARRLVSYVGKRGVQVRPLARDELLEMYVVRAALEGFAAELALPLVTKGDFRKMDRAARRFARLTESLRDADSGNLNTRVLASEWVEANDAFHDVFLNASGVVRLAEAARTVRGAFRYQAVFWVPGVEFAELHVPNVEQHREILEAFEQRSSKVRELVQDHILDSRRILEAALEDWDPDHVGQFGQRASWAGRPPSARV